jgi:hypothetical protein
VIDLLIIALVLALVRIEDDGRLEHLNREIGVEEDNDDIIRRIT